MANRVQVEVGANVTGFQQGMEQASQSAQKYKTDMRKVSESTVNFTKELRNAKREAQNLVAGYVQLDEAARNSVFGKEMSSQLNEASEKAAYFINLQGDIADGLNTLSSETATLDMLATGFATIGGIASASAGAIALFTGNEKDAQRAVVMFTTAQSLLNTITAAYNGIKKIQNVLLVKGITSTTLNTSVTNTNTVATKAATVAQAAFNKVATANPYVLLATAILTVVGALAAFIAFTNKSEAAERAEAKAAEEAKSIKEAYYNAYNQKLTETMGNYTKLQQEWNNLKSEGEKIQWIKDNENAFHELGYAINNTADAENFFVNNEQAVIDSFDARARAAAYAAQMVEVYNQALKSAPKAGDKISTKEAAKYGISEKGHEVDTNWFDDNEITLTKADEKKIREIKLQEARQTNKELGEERLAAEKKASEAEAKAGVKIYNKTREKELKKTTSTPKVKTDIEVKIEKNSLAESEKELKKLEEIRTKMSIDNPDLPKIKKQIEDTKKEIERKKIKLGLENEKTSVDFMSGYEKKLNDAVKAAESDYMEAYLKKQIDQLDKLWMAWNNAIHAQKVYMAVKKTQSPDQGIETSGNANLMVALKGLGATIEAYNDRLSQLQRWREEATNPRDIGEINNELAKTNSLLYDIIGHANKINPKSLKGIQEYISILQEKLMSTDFSFSDFGTTKDTTKLQQYVDRIVELKTQAAELQAALDEALMTPQEKAQKELEKTADKVWQVGDAVGACGELFSALGELGDDTTLNIAGIVAKAVATVALSYAQALASCKTWVEWLAFGVTGLGTMISMISSINQATNGYAYGGILPDSPSGTVGGSSYGGDRIWARLNSGEMVLNKRQQKNLFDLLDMDVMPQRGGTNVQVQGVIRGSDLILVQKNTNKVRSKSGTQIHF